MVCASVPTLVVFEAVLLTGIIVAGLFAYTFYAAKRGQDFGFLGPFLFTSLLGLMALGFIQIFFPMGPVANLILAFAGALVFRCVGGA